MKRQLLVALSALAASGTVAFAQDAAIEPETLTVQETIPEGPHLYVLDFSLNGPSSIYVLDADDLSLVGSIGAGTFATMAMSPDQSSLVSASIYMRRFTYGEVEAVIHDWDPKALAAKREFLVSDKIAQAFSQRGLVNLSADGKYLLVQNATPATSVTVADFTEGRELGEIPTPGCWTAYPTVEGTAFTTLCGDGTIAKYAYDAGGQAGEPAKSEKIFDADEDPLFGDAMRVDGKLVYVSYGGTLYIVDDSGAAPVLAQTVDFAEEGWAPGGYNLMAYNEPTKTLFVLMHSDPYDGSHKNPADEIWAIDMESMKVVGRSEAHHETNIAVSGGESPVLFGSDHTGGVHRYDVTVGDQVSLTPGASREGVALLPTILVTDF